MKNVLVSVMLLTILQQPDTPVTNHSSTAPASTGNVFIITTDGLRWQEIFTGADSLLINNEKATPGSDLLNMQYWDSNPENRRKKLMPFLWSVVAKKGQLSGNRLYNNKVDVANAYAISYPGYNEIFSGAADEMISSNKKYRNPNINVLEFLNSKEDFKGKVAAFTSWDVFPYIFNEKRSGMLVNSGYENGTENSLTQEIINGVQQEVKDKQATRHDQLTFACAKEYLQTHQPKLFFLGLGETDEFAHDGRYDLYLQQANAVDRMIAELWHWVQTTPGYKDNTTFIITTDHGRGSKTNRWTSHGAFIKGSSEVWLAMIGPGIEPLGEIKEQQQLYQRQLAQTIANLLGEDFDPGQPVAEAIVVKKKETVPSLSEKDRTVAVVNDARK
ncbi:MAG: alkaline phosphatase family protein [Chitinophagales bacterium]|nr:alkaline phosphatase family protein [Chitinophagales bacterium]